MNKLFIIPALIILGSIAIKTKQVIDSIDVKFKISKLRFVEIKRKFLHLKADIIVLTNLPVGFKTSLLKIEYVEFFANGNYIGTAGIYKDFEVERSLKQMVLDDVDLYLSISNILNSKFIIDIMQGTAEISYILHYKLLGNKYTYNDKI